jgi:hypothetical protein
VALGKTVLLVGGISSLIVSLWGIAPCIARDVRKDRAGQPVTGEPDAGNSALQIHFIVEETLVSWARSGTEVPPLGDANSVHSDVNGDYRFAIAMTPHLSAGFLTSIIGGVSSIFNTSREKPFLELARIFHRKECTTAGKRANLLV